MGFAAPDDPTGPEDRRPARPGDDSLRVPDDLSSLGDLRVPDDLSALEDTPSLGADAAAEPVVTLLVTQVADARALAAACSLGGIAVDAVPSPVGALAVLRSAVTAVDARTAAQALSRLVPTAPVLLLDRRAGRIAASRWSAGEHQEDLAAGLVMSGAPDVLEELLVGGTAPDQVPGSHTSVGMSRLAAMRALAAGRRRGQRG